MRFSVRATAALLRAPPLTRKRIDSGYTHASHGSTSSGTTPPTMNTACQPCSGTRDAVSRALIGTPMPTPRNPTTMAVLRCRAGAYSASSATITGCAPPMAMPATKRQAISCSRLVEAAVASAATPNTATLSTTARLRPQRSATTPSRNEPTAMPIVPAAKMLPMAGRPMPRSAVSAGAT